MVKALKDLMVSPFLGIFLNNRLDLLSDHLPGDHILLFTVPSWIKGYYTYIYPKTWSFLNLHRLSILRYLGAFPRASFLFLLSDGHLIKREDL